MVRVYAVFHVEQADGLTLERRDDDRDNEPEWKAQQTAERLIQESGVAVTHVRGDRAFYHLQTDRVTLPEREQFPTWNGYYQIALHELGHATGHPDRLDRDTLKNGVGKFGSTEHAREELRAEMAAMLTGDRIGGGAGGRCARRGAGDGVGARGDRGPASRTIGRPPHTGRGMSGGRGGDAGRRASTRVGGAGSGDGRRCGEGA